jgi:hypothetical protein
MGSHTHYYHLIYHLLLFREELSRIKETRFQELIRVLRTYQIDLKAEEPKIPTNKEIAALMNYKEPKSNQLLKDLHKEVLVSFQNEPLEVPEVVHVLHFSIGYDELMNSTKVRRENERMYSLWIEAKLPITPRIGEEISLSFIDGLEKHNHGFVHNVSHKITGKKQEILIEIHPYKNFYSRWKDLEIAYENKKIAQRHNEH